MVVDSNAISVTGIKMACSRNFADVTEALNSLGDLMVQEELEFIIWSNKGNSKLTIYAEKPSEISLVD